MAYEPIDLRRLTVTSLEDRPSKVRSADLGRTVSADASFRAWFDALPNILAGEGLRDLVSRTAKAIRGRRRFDPLPRIGCRLVRVLGACEDA